MMATKIATNKCNGKFNGELDEDDEFQDAQNENDFYEKIKEQLDKEESDNEEDVGEEFEDADSEMYVESMIIN